MQVDEINTRECPNHCYQGSIYTDLGHGDFEQVECEWCRKNSANERKRQERDNEKGNKGRTKLKASARV